MYFKQKLAYMGLGCLFTIIGYILASLGGDVDAQSEGDKSEPTVVDEIVCRKLKVVDVDGKTGITMGAHQGAGYMSIYYPSNKLGISIGAFLPSGGGYMSIYHPSGKPGIRIQTGSDGGSIIVYHQNGGPGVSIRTDSNGGYMNVSHASGKKAITIGIGDTSKEGFVQVQRKDQNGLIQLGANEYGGTMAIFNKGGENVLQASVGDMGGGIIITRDKHGYKTGDLP